MLKKMVEKSNKRLDVWLSEQQPENSRARWQKLIKENLVILNGQPTKPNAKLNKGDIVEWEIPAPKSVDVTPENIALDIIFEDEHIIAINKPAGLVVHPAPGNESGTLVNALLHHCKDLKGIGGEMRPGIVHRLDKDTSGIMVVAKTQDAMMSLSNQFKSRTTKKEYLAIVKGVPSPSNGKIETDIGRHPIYRKKMAVNVRGGRNAISLYETIETFDAAALLRVQIKTGRTHQIRVHMSHIKHPIVGDQLYGKNRNSKIIASRQMLHAEKLEIIHPHTNEPLFLKAPLASDIEKLLTDLRKLRT